MLESLFISSLKRNNQTNPVRMEIIDDPFLLLLKSDGKKGGWNNIGAEDVSQRD